MHSICLEALLQLKQPEPLSKYMVSRALQRGRFSLKDRKAGHPGYWILQLAAALLVAGAALLVLSKAFTERTGSIPLEQRFHTATGSPFPPKAFFQSIEQDLAPWNITGITCSQVRIN